MLVNPTMGWYSTFPTVGYFNPVHWVKSQ